MKYSILIFLALLFSTASQAENWYVGGGAGLINSDDGEDIIEPTNLYFRIGYQFNQNFNIGLESSVTVVPDQIPNAPDVDLSVDTVTFYIRGGAPITDSIFVYAQFGQTNTEITAELNGFEFSVDDDDSMIGIGAEIDLTSKSNYLAINWSRYNSSDGVDITGFNIGLGGRF